MRDTSGPTSSEPFAQYDPVSSSWRMCATTSELGSMMSSAILPASGSQRSGQLFVHPPLAPPTDVPDSSASPGQPKDYLSTPSHADGTGGPGTSPKREGGMNLRTAAALIPTPSGRDWKGTRPEGRVRSDGYNRGEGDRQLPDAVALLPTPTVGNIEGGNKTRSGDRSNERLLPGLAEDFREAEVALLATPRASDAINGGPNQCNSRGEYDALHGQVHESRFGKYAEAVRRWEQVTDSTAPDPTEPTGRDGNHRLSPAFACWMMYPEIVSRLTSSILTRKQQLTAIGNSCVPLQAAHAVTGLLARRLSS